MLDPEDLRQVTSVARREALDILAFVGQPPGSYRFLCALSTGHLAYTHKPVGVVLREF